jgi:hypothetical protein
VFLRDWLDDVGFLGLQGVRRLWRLSHEFLKLSQVLHDLVFRGLERRWGLGCLGLGFLDFSNKVLSSFWSEFCTGVTVEIKAFDVL